MPIPTPSKNESKKSFMDRCVDQVSDEFDSQKQRIAICLEQFNKNKDGE